MHLEIVTGKGGVGKSAVAAGLALHLAHQGARVLALATTDPRGLGAHLGRQSVGVEADEVRDGLFLSMISPGPALQEYLRRNLKVPTPRIGLAVKAFDVLASTAPGIKEIITIGKIVSEIEDGEWDAVVVDAPATGQVGAYLNAPSTVANLVASGRVRDQADRMRNRLTSPDTRLTIVTLAEELPIAETKEACTNLAETCGTMRVVANRILSRLRVPATVIGSMDASPARDAASLHQSLHSAQQHWLAEIDHERTLPQLFGVLTPHEVAARLSEQLT